MAVELPLPLIRLLFSHNGRSDVAFFCAVVVVAAAVVSAFVFACVGPSLQLLPYPSFFACYTASSGFSLLRLPFTQKDIVEYKSLHFNIRQCNNLLFQLMIFFRNNNFSHKNFSFPFFSRRIPHFSLFDAFRVFFLSLHFLLLRNEKWKKSMNVISQ